MKSKPMSISDFLKEYDFPVNEHGVTIIYSKDGTLQVNIHALLEDFAEQCFNPTTDAFRNFIRQNQLTAKWEQFMKDNNFTPPDTYTHKF